MICLPPNFQYKKWTSARVRWTASQSLYPSPPPPPPPKKKKPSPPSPYTSGVPRLVSACIRVLQPSYPCIAAVGQGGAGTWAAVKVGSASGRRRATLKPLVGSAGRTTSDCGADADVTAVTGRDVTQLGRGRAQLAVLPGAMQSASAERNNARAGAELCTLVYRVRPLRGAPPTQAPNCAHS